MVTRFMPNLVWMLPGLDPGCKFCFGPHIICPLLMKLAMCSRTCSRGPAGIPNTGESNSVFIDGCYLGPSVTDQIFFLECIAIGPLWDSVGVPFDQFGFPLGLSLLGLHGARKEVLGALWPLRESSLVLELPLVSLGCLGAIWDIFIICFEFMIRSHTTHLLIE
jgi:hypothetical protein